MQWFRFDPERNERRNVTIAAYDRKRECDRELRKLQANLETLKTEGVAEEVEHISSVKHERGYLASIRQIRQLDRQKRRDQKRDSGWGSE